jgi:hypothetical protein
MDGFLHGMQRWAGALQVVLLCIPPDLAAVCNSSVFLCCMASSAVPCSPAALNPFPLGLCSRGCAGLGLSNLSHSSCVKLQCLATLRWAHACMSSLYRLAPD